METGWRKRTGIEPAEAVSPHPPPDLKSEARTSVAIASAGESTEKLLKSCRLLSRLEELRNGERIALVSRL